MKCKRRIHERAHLFVLDDRLSRDVEGEMVPSVARLFHQRGCWLTFGSPRFYKKLCERLYGRIVLISAIFRNTTLDTDRIATNARIFLNRVFQSLRKFFISILL